mgnify:CR=1 FL=1
MSLSTSRLRTSPMTKLQVAAVVLHLRCVFDAIISIQINDVRRFSDGSRLFSRPEGICREHVIAGLEKKVEQTLCLINSKKMK